MKMGSLMKRVTIQPTAVVDKSATIGKGTRIWNFVHIRENAEIGRDCVLGDYVYVGRGVKIGNKVKLENRVTVYEGVKIEDNVFVGPHVTFTNDPYPRSLSTDWKIQPTIIKEGSSIGARTVIVCGNTIGKYAMIGAGSVVTHYIPAHALAYGNPAMIKAFVCRCGNKLVLLEKTDSRVQLNCPKCREIVRTTLEDYRKVEKEG